MSYWIFLSAYGAIVIANQLFLSLFYFKRMKSMEDLVHESAKCICILMDERKSFLNEKEKSEKIYKPIPKVEKLYPEKQDDDRTS